MACPVRRGNRSQPTARTYTSWLSCLSSSACLRFWWRRLIFTDRCIRAWRHRRSSSWSRQQEIWRSFTKRSNRTTPNPSGTRTTKTWSYRPKSHPNNNRGGWRDSIFMKGEIMTWLAWSELDIWARIRLRSIRRSRSSTKPKCRRINTSWCKSRMRLPTTTEMHRHSLLFQSRSTSSARKDHSRDSWWTWRQPRTTRA